MILGLGPNESHTLASARAAMLRRELVTAFSVVAASAAVYLWVDSILGLLTGAAAALYLCRTNPRGLLCVIFALAPFNQNIAALPVNLAAADLIAMAALPAAMLGRRARLSALGRSTVWRPVGAYLALCVASAGLQSADADAVVSIAQMLVYLVGVPLLAGLLVESGEDLVLPCWCLMSSSAVIALALIVVGPGYVLNMHKNAAGSSLCMALVAALAMLLARPTARRGDLRLVATALVLGFGLLWSLSRGAWLGAAVAVVFLLAATRRVRVLLALVAPLTITLVVGWKLLPEEKRTYASDVSFEAYNIKERFKSFDYAYAQFSKDPLLGVGVGFRKTYDATNVVMSTMAETGVVGLALFLSIFATVGWTVWRSTRAGGRRVAVPFPVALGAGLVFAKLAHGMVDQYWARGAFTPWFGFGLVVMGTAQLGVARRADRGGSPSAPDRRPLAQRNTFSRPPRLADFGEP